MTDRGIFQGYSVSGALSEWAWIEPAGKRLGEQDYENEKVGPPWDDLKPAGPDSATQDRLKKIDALDARIDTCRRGLETENQTVHAGPAHGKKVDNWQKTEADKIGTWNDEIARAEAKITHLCREIAGTI